MSKSLTMLLLLPLLVGCSAANNYAHDNFDMVDKAKFVDPDTSQEYYIQDKPAEGRMKMMLGAGTTMGMLVTGRNAVPPLPLYEAAAVRFLARYGRTCSATRSFEIVMSEVEVQYSCI